MKKKNKEFCIIPPTRTKGFLQTFLKTLVQWELGQGEFIDGLVVRIQFFHCHSAGSIPGWGTGISHAAQPKKTIE